MEKKLNGGWLTSSDLCTHTHTQREPPGKGSLETHFVRSYKLYTSRPLMPPFPFLHIKQRPWPLSNNLGNSAFSSRWKVSARPKKLRTPTDIYERKGASSQACTTNARCIMLSNCAVQLQCNVSVFFPERSFFLFVFSPSHLNCINNIFFLYEIEQLFPSGKNFLWRHQTQWSLFKWVICLGTDFPSFVIPLAEAISSSKIHLRAGGWKRPAIVNTSVLL